MRALRLAFACLLAVAIGIHLVALSQRRSRRRCFLCRGPMPNGDVDGHGLGECVGICDDCDGAGCRQCLWLGAAEWDTIAKPGSGNLIWRPMSRGRMWWLFLNAPLWTFIWP